MSQHKDDATPRAEALRDRYARILAALAEILADVDELRELISRLGREADQ